MTSATDPTPAGRAPRLARVPLGVLLLVTLLVPLLGLAGFSGRETVARWSDRDASLAQQQGTVELTRVVEVRAALADEETYSTILVLGETLGADPDLLVGDGPPAADALVEARARLDRALQARPIATVSEPPGDLAAVRRALDAGTVDHPALAAAFATLNAAVDDELTEVEGVLERAADGRPQTSGARARLRALRETFVAFSSGNDRIRQALDLLVFGPSS